MKEQLIEIKAQIAELVLKVDQLEIQDASTSDYTFTKKEMITFVSHLHAGFIESVRHNLDRISYDTDCVSLDLYDKTIEVDIDSNQINDEVMANIDTELDDDAVQATVNEIYNGIKF